MSLEKYVTHSVPYRLVSYYEAHVLIDICLGRDDNLAYLTHNITLEWSSMASPIGL